MATVSTLIFKFKEYKHANIVNFVYYAKTLLLPLQKPLCIKKSELNLQDVMLPFRFSNSSRVYSFNMSSGCFDKITWIKN